MDKELLAKELVEGLSDLKSGESVQIELLSLGRDAVASLAEFLLRCPGNLRPRSLAAEALGIIGGHEAFQALVKGLDAFRNIDDPVLALEEEAVKNRIASELKNFERESIAPLLEALREQHLIAAAEAIAELGEPGAIPNLVELLEDSFRRRRVSAVLLKFGIDAVEELGKTTRVKKIEEGFEILHSIERRAEATKVLGLLGNERIIPWLLGLLDDEQEIVRLEASLSLVTLTREKIPKRAIEIIKASLRNPNLETRLRVEEALCLMNIRGKGFQLP